MDEGPSNTNNNWDNLVTSNLSFITFKVKINVTTYVHFLNQVHCSCRLACTWFFKITFMQTCTYVCVCAYVCVPATEAINN